MTRTMITPAERKETTAAGPVAWMTTPLPTNSPAPITPPSAMRFMCRFLRPCWSPELSSVVVGTCMALPLDSVSQFRRCGGQHQRRAAGSGRDCGLDVVEHRVDAVEELRENLAVGHQGWRDHDHGGAAVVAAQDPSGAPEGCGQALAQDLRRLLVGELPPTAGVRHELDRVEEARAADVADTPVPPAQLLQARAQVRSLRAHVRQDALVAHGGDVGDSDGRRDRVTAPGRAVGEGPGGGLEEGRGQRFADDDPAQGRVARRRALREGDEVRDDTQHAAAEPVAEAPKRADDLVGDQEDAVPVADLAQRAPVAVRWDQRAAAVLDRLGEDGPDRPGALLRADGSDP